MRFDEYFELSEKSGWRVTDLDWSRLTDDDAAGRVSEFDREALLGTAVIEHGVPHYGEVWTLVEHLHDHWDLWQFTTLWTGEEHRHSFALKRACELLGIVPRIAGDLASVSEFPFAVRQKESCEDDCYRTVAGMLTYAMVQELATQRFYAMAARRTESTFLRDLFHAISADEMRHHVFFREALRELWEASDDKAAYIDQIVRAVSAFKMPHLIYKLQEEFFEGKMKFGIGADIKAQLARCFSFDFGLLSRLAAAHPVASAA